MMKLLKFTIFIITASRPHAHGALMSHFLSQGHHRASETLLYQNNKDSLSDDSLSRRDIVLLSVGASAYAKVASSAIAKLKRGDAYPPEHEDRVSKTFGRAILDASSCAINRPLRLLEVGIGDQCRTISRGLYDEALSNLSKSTTAKDGIEMIGVDISAPSEDMAKAAAEKLRTDHPSLSLTFNAMRGDIVEGLHMFPDDYFDSITMSLVLCSVSDQTQALNEVKRLLNPAGGTFGYIEHVAVNLENEEEKRLSFLKVQQDFFDPLQQLVAHNCHLHRETEVAIASAFGLGGSEVATLIDSERFICPGMWPVSLQCCGVVKLLS